MKLRRLLTALAAVPVLLSAAALGLDDDEDEALAANQATCAALHSDARATARLDPLARMCGLEEDTTDTALDAGGVPARYRALLTKWGRTCPTLTPPRLAALLKQESGFRADAGSPAGARGIAQFMPATWRVHGFDANRDGKTDILDPHDAIPSAARYLCTLAKTVHAVPGSRINNMLAAYNAGPGAVKQYRGIPPYNETRHYVTTIRRLEKTLTTTGNAPASGSARRVLAAARAHIGKPYVWGGGNKNGPTGGGFDCSGLLVHAFWKGARVELPRTSQQMRHTGKKVSQKGMKPGDLIVIDSDGNWGHVIVYAGAGHAIEAPRTGLNVREITLNEWKGKAWDVRRVL